MQTDRVTASRELAKKVTDFLVSLQPQATVDNASSEVHLLKKQVELLQQQLIGFQQPSSGASTVSSAEAIGPTGALPSSQPTVPSPTVHESSNEPVLLPQPNSPAVTSAQIRGRAGRFAEILSTLDQFVAPIPENVFQYLSFGIAEVLPVIHLCRPCPSTPCPSTKMADSWTT